MSKQPKYGHITADYPDTKDGWRELALARATQLENSTRIYQDAIHKWEAEVKRLVALCDEGASFIDNLKYDTSLMEAWEIARKLHGARL